MNSQVKFPQCWKMAVASLTDWSQWFKLFNPTNQYLWGFLDGCSMTEDAPQVTMWEWQPVTSDSGDVLITPNDISQLTQSYSVSVSETGGAGTSSAGIGVANHLGKTRYFYNTPGVSIDKTFCLAFG